ncbi:hypothetical protein C0989_009988 [Termitomyces sp. Mn162]|nr:hypothetical protein C0989_009988 [Termitomyces sp. Mn162]
MDHVLATFYILDKSTLYIVKNRPRNPQDEAALTSFLNELKGAKRFLDPLPFLARHRAETVSKQLQQFRHSFFYAYGSSERRVEKYLGCAP